MDAHREAYRIASTLPVSEWKAAVAGREDVRQVLVQMHRNMKHWAELEDLTSRGVVVTIRGAVG